MFHNVALDVAIGLVFIYLLYSLLATVIGEIIAVQLNMRASNLKLAVSRMLNDEEDKGFLGRLWNTIMFLRTARDTRTERFYGHPEIKYLGSSGLAKSPSCFKAASFSKTLMFQLNDAGPISQANIDTKLRIEADRSLRKGADDQFMMGVETAEYVLSLWEDSYKDIAKFKLHLENWFDRTMEQTSEWYKRKIQTVLIIVGFMLAWSFNADTFVIIKKLSIDKDAREQMVQMASAYTENNRYSRDTNIPAGGDSATNSAKYDSLMAIKQQLVADISNSQTLLGSGGWPKDSITLIKDSTGKVIATLPLTEVPLLNLTKKETEKGYKIFAVGDKLGYFFRLCREHFWGFAVTAIAISLGAPFWFDMLNKMMKMRTSTKQEVTASNNSVQAQSAKPEQS